MTEISYSEEFTIDWDWYAFDAENNLGHFTSAAFRTLPQSVKRDREATERLTQYFFKEATNRCGYIVRPSVEKDAGGWKNPGTREWYLKSYVEMASKGAFSYDTQMVQGHDAKYYLVAKPEHPLRSSDLPPEIREMVSRVRAPLLFATAEYISEADTLNW